MPRAQRSSLRGGNAMKNIFRYIYSLQGIIFCICLSWGVFTENADAADQLKFPTRSNGPISRELFETTIGTYSGENFDNGKGDAASFQAERQIEDKQRLLVPKPMAGNTGRYLSPYTSDKVLAEWTDKMIRVKLGSSVGSVAGSTVGTIAGQEALKQIPVFGGMLGGMLGKKIGESVGKTMTLQVGGGWDFIKKTSDISFNSLDELAVYLYINNSNHEHFQLALEALTILYPEFSDRYQQAVAHAPLAPAGDLLAAEQQESKKDVQKTTKRKRSKAVHE